MSTLQCRRCQPLSHFQPLALCYGIFPHSQVTGPADSSIDAVAMPTLVYIGGKLQLGGSVIQDKLFMAHTGMLTSFSANTDPAADRCGIILLSRLHVALTTLMLTGRCHYRCSHHGRCVPSVVTGRCVCPVSTVAAALLMLGCDADITAAVVAAYHCCYCCSCHLADDPLDTTAYAATAVSSLASRCSLKLARPAPWALSPWAQSTPSEPVRSHPWPPFPPPLFISLVPLAS